MLSEQCRILYEHSGVAVSGALASLFFVVFTLRDECPGWLLITWALSLTSLYVGRFFVIRYYRRLPREKAVGQSGFWLNLHRLGTLATGLAWGACGVFLFPDSLANLALMIVVIGGLSAASTATYAAAKGGSSLFVTAALLPFTVKIIAQGDQPYLGIGILMVAFTAAMFVSARRMHEATVDSLRLGIENADLVRYYGQARDQLEALNHELVREVSERRRVENELRGERNLFVDGPVVVFRWRAKKGWPVEYVSPNISQFGYSVEALLNGTVPFVSLVHPDDVHRVKSDVDRYAYSGTRSFSQDYRIVTAGGEPRWVSDTTVPVRDAQGRVTHYDGYILDITERKRAEAEIVNSQRELQRILDDLQDTYYRTDAQGRIVKVSSSVKALLGYEADEMLGQKMAVLYVDAGGRAEFLEHLKRNGGEVRNYEAALRRKDGGIVWVSTNARYCRGEDGEVLGVEGITRDVTPLKQAEEALHEAKERAEVTLQAIGDGVVTTDPAGRVEYLNPVAEQLTGWRAGDAAGQALTAVFHVVDEDNGLDVSDPSQLCLQEKRRISLPGNPILRRRGDKTEYSVEATIGPIRNLGGDVMGTVLVFHDVTELRGLARKMSYQATHDSLTGLINRAEFERRLQRALDSLSEDSGQTHALMYLDLDQFKLVNDTCGHAAGDELLRELTAQLQARVRGSDLLARLGGDEFGVLLENCTLDEAIVVAEELRRLTTLYRFQWQDKAFEVGVSIGLVPIDSTTGSLAEVLSTADAACYVAKDLGRNRVHVVTPGDTALAQHHGQMQWVQQIKEALSQNRLVLYCQTVLPLFHGTNGSVYHEILMRMRGESGELILPSAYLSAAERYHLMPLVDRHVVKNAFEMLKTQKMWLNKEIYAINISGQSLTDESFFHFVVDMLDRTGIPPERVCFEITETAAVSNMIHAVKFINILKGMGCLFALDDFGSGLSSFGYLRRLPVDFVKIDGRFVRNIAEDQIDHALVDAINNIGHTFGMRTIAEFVENDGIKQRLVGLGVDYAQGYGIARPRPLQECMPLCAGQI